MTTLFRGNEERGIQCGFLIPRVEMSVRGREWRRDRRALPSFLPPDRSVSLDGGEHEDNTRSRFIRGHQTGRGPDIEGLYAGEGEGTEFSVAKG